MPLHSLGVPLPNGRFGLTFADLMSVIVAILFYAQPGVDHRAVYEWIVDHAFMGSVAACAISGTFWSHKLLEWGGLAFWKILYKIDEHKDSLPVPAVGHFVHSAKLDPATPWHWEDPDQRVVTKAAKLERKSIRYTMLFHACVCVVQFLLWLAAVQFTWKDGWLTWDWKAGYPEFKRADPALIPSKATVAYQCLVSTLVAEAGFYCMHRLMHETRLYYWHKRHHEFVDATVFATFYVGLFDSVITDMIPAGFGVVFFDMHQWTIWLFSLPLIYNAMKVHCGFDNARWVGFNVFNTLPFCTDAERTHDMHHRYNNCNYGGAYFLMDRLCGTWRNPDSAADMAALRGKAAAAAKPVVAPASTEQVAAATTGIKGGKSE